MLEFEYIQLQSRLKKKLEFCNGLTGKRKEGFEEGIKTAMSILHSFYNEKGMGGSSVE